MPAKPSRPSTSPEGTDAAIQRNSLRLGASILQTDSLRFTPAGLPALNLVLRHESQSVEGAGQREVKLAMKAVAFGATAERLARQAVGSIWEFRGFLANARKSQSVLFHIQEFIQI
jgi:primosomal replication protein N